METLLAQVDNTIDAIVVGDTVDQTGAHDIPTSMAPSTAVPLTGSPEEIADGMRAFAAEGIDHLQVSLAPNTVASIESFAAVLEALDR